MIIIINVRNWHRHGGDDGPGEWRILVVPFSASDENRQSIEWATFVPMYKIQPLAS